VLLTLDFKLSSTSTIAEQVIPGSAHWFCILLDRSARDHKLPASTCARCWQLFFSYECNLEQAPNCLTASFCSHQTAFLGKSSSNDASLKAIGFDHARLDDPKVFGVEVIGRVAKTHLRFRFL
jgi:hypothetical protein